MFREVSEILKEDKIIKRSYRTSVTKKNTISRFRNLMNELKIHYLELNRQ